MPPYRFFYRADGGTVWIVGVGHSAELPELAGRLSSLPASCCDQSFSTMITTYFTLRNSTGSLIRSFDF